MSCAKGCCATARDHYRSLAVSASVEDRRRMTKTTTDVHDHHSVSVTEHYTDRQDVTVHAPRVAVQAKATEIRD